MGYLPCGAWNGCGVSWCDWSESCGASCGVGIAQRGETGCNPFTCVPGTLTCLSSSGHTSRARSVGGVNDGVEVAMDGADPPSSSRPDPLPDPPSSVSALPPWSRGACDPRSARPTVAVSPSLGRGAVRALNGPALALGVQIDGRGSECPRACAARLWLTASCLSRFFYESPFCVKKIARAILLFS